MSNDEKVNQRLGDSTSDADKPKSPALDYRAMAKGAVTPFFVSTLGPERREKLIAEWAEWLERAGVTEPSHARELVEATVRERISGLKEPRKDESGGTA